MNVLQPTPFLTGEWRYLVMVNCEVDPEVLRSLVPSGTELDEWNGQSFVSLAGYLFLNTRLLGSPIQRPVSAFLAEGSEVMVFRGTALYP
jgi:uncharacterized protein YqjF (DUF2071 family)